LTRALKDLEYFILVALHLLEVPKDPTKQRWAKNDPVVPLPEPIFPEVDQNIKDTLKAIEMQKLQKFTLFGRERDEDFSQFKPRGHYQKSEELSSYFKCLMWLGRIELQEEKKEILIFLNWVLLFS